MRRAFTMVELLVVIAIIALLAALLFPVLARAKASAKNTICLSNLNQIGKAMLIYMESYDDVFPFAVDASDKYAPEIWSGYPEWMALIPSMPTMQDALEPYLRNKQVFECPRDNGTKVLDNHFPQRFLTSPSMFKTYGSSYFFRTEIAFRAYSQTNFQLPADVNVMFDGAGHWHGATRMIEPDDDFQTYFKLIREYRYHTLYGDFRVKSLSYDQLQRAWETDL
jgi:prepilin-type N-terminal cleavage/methylation domain-containing protein